MSEKFIDNRTHKHKQETISKKTENSPFLQEKKTPHDIYTRLWDAYEALIYHGSLQFFKSRRYPHLQNYVKDRAVPKKSYDGKQIFYEVKKRDPDTIKRTELLELARLPDDFELPPFPEVPSAEEVEKLIAQRTAGLALGKINKPQRIKAYFKALKKLPYCRVACDAILRASNYYDAKGNFLPRLYESLIADYRKKHKIIAEILDRRE